MSKIICDFCGATDSRDNPVIAGDNACICKACVTAANEIMSGNLPVEEGENKTPREHKPVVEVDGRGDERRFSGPPCANHTRALQDPARRHADRPEARHA